MKVRDRILLVALVGGAVAVGAGVVALASQLCPAPSLSDPCPDADRNRLLVVTLAALGLGLAVAPTAWVVEYLARRRIAYAGAWTRALRRGTWAGLALGVIAALRAAEALNAFSVAVVVIVLAAAEWVAVRRLDEP